MREMADEPIDAGLRLLDGLAEDAFGLFEIGGDGCEELTSRGKSEHGFHDVS